MLVLNLIFLAHVIARIIATTEHSCEEVNLTSVTLVAENSTVSITCCGNEFAGVYVLLHDRELGPGDNGLNFNGKAPSGCEKVTFPLAQESCNLTVRCKAYKSPYKNFSMENAMDYCSFSNEGSTQDENLCNRTIEITPETDPTTATATITTVETDGSTSSSLITATSNKVVGLVISAVVPAAIVILVAIVLSFVTAALIILYRRNQRNETATRDEIATEQEQKEQKKQEEELPPGATSMRQEEEEQYPTVSIVYARGDHEHVYVDKSPGPYQGGNCKEFTSLDSSNLHCETDSPQYQQCSDQSPRLTGQAFPVDNSYRIYKDCQTNLTVITEQPGKN